MFAHYAINHGTALEVLRQQVNYRRLHIFRITKSDALRACWVRPKSNEMRVTRRGSVVTKRRDDTLSWNTK